MAVEIIYNLLEVGKNRILVVLADGPKVIPNALIFYQDTWISTGVHRQN
jgi:hypothetical protein